MQQGPVLSWYAPGCGSRRRVGFRSRQWRQKQMVQVLLQENPTVSPMTKCQLCRSNPLRYRGLLLSPSMDLYLRRLCENATCLVTFIIADNSSNMRSFGEQHEGIALPFGVWFRMFVSLAIQTPVHGAEGHPSVPLRFLERGLSHLVDTQQTPQ